MNIKKNEILKTVFKFVMIYVIAIISGIVLLMAVYSIPTKQMTENVVCSEEMLSDEGDYPEMVDGYKCTQLDNYTDKIMLGSAIYEGNESVIEKVIEVYRYGFGDEADTRTEYSWYWHGYLVILKPLLFIMSYADIRMLNYVVSAVLIFWLFLSTIKRDDENKKLLIPFFTAILVLNPLAIGSSIQFSTVWYVALGELLWLTNSKKAYGNSRTIKIFKSETDNDFKKRQISIITSFFCSGIILAYVDLLTYPVVAFGLPLVAVIYYEQRMNTSLKDVLIIMFECFISFFAGYATMLAGKWIIGFVILHNNSWASAKAHMLERVSGTGMMEDIHRIDAVIRNFGVLYTKPFVLIALALLMAFIVMIVLGKKKFIAPWKAFIVSIPYFLTALFPIAWYLILANHSHAHYFFTYRDLAVVVCSVMMIAGMITENKKGNR